MYNMSQTPFPNRSVCIFKLEQLIGQGIIGHLQGRAERGVGGITPDLSAPGVTPDLTAQPYFEVSRIIEKCFIHAYI